MKRTCYACHMKIDKNNYLRDKTVCKSVTIRLEEKTMKTPKSKINNQKMIMLTLTIKIEPSTWDFQIGVKLI